MRSAFVRAYQKNAMKVRQVENQRNFKYSDRKKCFRFGPKFCNLWKTTCTRCEHAAFMVVFNFLNPQMLQISDFPSTPSSAQSFHEPYYYFVCVTIDTETDDGAVRKETTILGTYMSFRPHHGRCTKFSMKRDCHAFLLFFQSDSSVQKCRKCLRDQTAPTLSIVPTLWQTFSFVL